LVDLLTPAFTLRHQAQLPRFSTTRLPERFGLFILITLGESIIGTVQGMADQEQLSLLTGISGVLGMALSFALWWVYFDFIARRPAKPGIGWAFAWSYLHLPLLLAIAATGAGVLNVIGSEEPVLPDNVRLLIAGAVGTALTVMALLEMVLRREPDEPTHPRVSPLLKLIAAVFAYGIGLWGSGLGAIALLCLLLVLLAVQMGYGLLVWYRPHPV
jgi:low temperature requirement protein LtrA